MNLVKGNKFRMKRSGEIVEFSHFSVTGLPVFHPLGDDNGKDAFALEYPLDDWIEELKYDTNSFKLDV